ncbi:MAG: hypothetical protein NTU83_04690 [Candidatus Hydrogenedentes bacterium]|nr:hypothetical protein [Candidatus Hydrogenedentota bacterium]
MLEIVASQGTFALERLEDACKANHKSGVLTRIALVLSQGSTTAARFEMHSSFFSRERAIHLTQVDVA